MIVGHLLMFFGVIVIAYAVMTAATGSGKLDPASSAAISPARYAAATATAAAR